MEVTTGKRFKKTAQIFRAIFFLASIGLLILLLLYISILLYAKVQGAPPLAVPQSSLFYSNDGTVIGETNSGQKRYWIPLEEISPHMVDAVLAVEDRDFYEHGGFDYKRIAGAALADIKAMAKVQGASTITQQYARNLFLNHEKSWFRKAKEALYTIRIEMNYTKDEILEGYLNTIYFGHGTYGIQAASHYYFEKDALQLTLDEAAMLAGIPKGPSYYSPFLSPEKAKDRQDIVLSTMHQSGYITKQQWQQAKLQPIHLNGQHEQQKKIAPYFFQAVQQVLKNDLQLDETLIALGGLKIYTTLDLTTQEASEAAFHKYLSLDNELQGALVAMNPHSGEVKALIGGKNFEQSPFNRATQAVRQPGSTIKPLLYYSALENGFTPATMLKSEATIFTFDDGKAEYKPRNFNSQYANKEITLAQAIALSDNIYAVKTHLFLGEKLLKKTANHFGIKSEIEAVPSAALGTSGVKVIEMVNAYSRIASGGKAVEPIFIKKIENHKGEIIYEASPVQDTVLDVNQTFVLTSMLTGIFNKDLNGYATVTGSSLIPKLSRQYAGKSGTTETDSWMIGYSPELVTGVWTGYDQGKKLTHTAERMYAKNIWADTMESSLQPSAVNVFESTSDEIIAIKINPESGKIATKDCPKAVVTHFIKGTEPTEYCTLHLDNHNEQPKETPEKKEKLPWYKRWNPFL